MGPDRIVTEPHFKAKRFLSYVYITAQDARALYDEYARYIILLSRAWRGRLGSCNSQKMSAVYRRYRYQPCDLGQVTQLLHINVLYKLERIIVPTYRAVERIK